MRQREIALTGLRPGHRCEVFFDDVEVPADHVIGPPGDAGRRMTSMWNGNRPLLGLIATGIAAPAIAAAPDSRPGQERR